MTESAREAAVRKATCWVLPGDDSGDSGSEDELGVGAIAEMPSGVPIWAPKIFFARAHTYTRAWQRQMLRKFGPSYNDAYPRISEGDATSNMML